MRLIEEANPEFESCDDCIHSDDSEKICIFRGCIHAIYRLKECYVPKSRTGKWQLVSADRYIYRCDVCEKITFGLSDWCPNCGARMEEGE